MRFLDGEDAGIQEWAGGEQLPARWDDAQKVIQDDVNLATAIEESKHLHGSPEWEAAKLVFLMIRPKGRIHMLHTKVDAGVVRIKDLGKVAPWLRMDEHELLEAEGAFVDRYGTYIAPWPVTLRIARRAAELQADTVLEEILRRLDSEREYLDQRRSWERGRGEKKVARLEAVARLLHTWCGEETLERYDELEALRAEVRRLGLVVEKAIAALRQNGHRAIAATIERDLGVRTTTSRDRDR
ncbi:hypothetical protein [Actinomadura rupiterrae]|uniref:hypothetical protein n=1 Tax=Actinomadura rupiterrae TaxID=559627 RepID=UPI0020A53976|nr:hypothetical protein [Actinomadura rupiterrae]MCP2342990.1 hypothetical protein [Actinomadura rupiterrae]